MNKPCLDPNFYCTVRGCNRRAKWWKIVRIDGLDVEVSRCEEHRD